jgi:hypothetical protein
MSTSSDNHEISLHEFLTAVTCYLEDLTAANTRLLDALNKYQDLLVQGDTASIEKATPRLDRLAGEIRVLDEKRRAYVDDYFTCHGWDGPRNFSAIANRVRELGVSDDEALAFERASVARMKLIEILAQVDARNSLNLTLIGQGMSFAEVSLRALLGMDSETSSYGPAEDGNEDGPSLLDAQA